MNPRRRIRLAGCISAAAAVVALAPATAQAVPDPLAFETANGSVFAVAPGSGGVTYLGGSFTEVRAHAERAVRVSTATGKRNAPSPAVDGTVNATAPDGGGGFFIGGNFTTVNGEPREDLAHILADGTVNPAFAPSVSEGVATPQVMALAVADGALYVGGAFGDVGGVDRDNLAKVSTTTGNVFTTWDPDPSHSVNAIAISGSALFIGGDFSQVGSETRFGAAKVSTTSGNVFSGWQPNPTGGSHGINSIAVSGDAVYFGGGFEEVTGSNQTLDAGEARQRIARVSATTGNLFSFNAGTVTAISATPSVDAIVVLGSEVFAGGVLSQIGGQTRNGLAKLSATTGNAFSGWNATANQQTVRALVTDGAAVYAAGDFTVIGGQQRPRTAKLSLDDADAFLGFNMNPNSQVNALALSGSNLHAGGFFTAVNTVTRNRIAAHDANGAPTDWNPDADQAVFALAASGSDVYAGGSFTDIGGLARNKIAKLSAASGNAFSGWDPDAGASGFVGDIELSGSEVYVGGLFANIGGLARDNIAKLSATSGNAFSTWNPDADDEVRDIEVSGSDVLAGGDFVTIGGQSRDSVAKLSATSGNAFSGFNPGTVNGEVNAVVPVGSELYVGGEFAEIGGQARNNIAKLSTASGNAFSGFNPDANNDVLALFLDGAALYLGGQFTTVGGQTRNRLARLSASSGGVSSTFNPNMSADVEALAVSGGTLHVGGEFTTVGGDATRAYAWFRNP